MGAESNRKHHEKRRWLFAQQEGRCHFCKCEMLPELAGKRPFPKNLATLFHLRDRFHPLRHVPSHGKKVYVVACWQCSNEQGARRQAEQPIELLHHLSGRHPDVWDAPSPQESGTPHD